MEAFGVVLIVVAVVAALVAAASFWGSGKVYKGLGRTGALSLDEPAARPGPKPGSAAAQAEDRKSVV